ncbi:MAG TPA: L,D-transpeptidase [Solirubrobacteraceae bacterium]
MRLGICERVPRRGLTLLAILAGAFLAASGGAEARGPTSTATLTPAPGRTALLSNERTLSRWAYVLRPALARRAPDVHAATVLKLEPWTLDNTPELVLLLKQHTARDGAPWVLARLPMRPNGKLGWLPRSALGRFHVVRTNLVIDRATFSAVLYRSGHPIWRAPIGIGKPSTPTPTGIFYVRERLVPRDPNTIYGIFAFGTSGYSPTLTDWPEGGVIGIHGTNQPQFIPGAISHGCVRLRNQDVARLRQLMGLGTPIRIM